MGLEWQLSTRFDFDSLRRRSPQDSIPPQLNAILQELGTRKRI